MHVDVRKTDDVVVVDLEGQLVAGTGSDLLHEVMNELLGRGWPKILLNLEKVSRIDSSGVGELVASIKLGERVGTAVKLVQGGRKVHDVLDISHILPLLDMYSSEEEALASFAD